MVDKKVETTETARLVSSLENDKTVKDDSVAIEKSVMADSTTKSEGQATGEEDQVATKPKAEGEDAGKSDGAEEKHKAVIEAAETKDKAISDGSKNAAANGQGGASSQHRDTGDRRSGYKRGGQQGSRKFEDYRKNVKTDFTAQKESEDPVEIRKQVEFYFSEANLATDKFLLEKVGGSTNNAVPISVLHSFKRMRHFQPFSAVVAALKESTVLDVVDDDSVKRRVPLDETFNETSIEQVKKVYETAAMARSVYVKGFGEETPSTQFDIEAFFTPYGPTNAIRLRRTTNKLFKGSVFVEFDSEETQKAFLALDPKPKWKGTDLTIKSKKAYCDEKVDDIQAGKIRRNSPDTRKGDDRDWRVRRDEDRKGGFKDDRNKGGNRGSGRGRGRGRGRGGRDNNNRDKERFDKSRKLRDEHTVPAVATSTPESAGEVPPAAFPEASKKRSREADDVGDEQGDAKKADVKTQIDTSRAHIESVSKPSLKREREGDEGGEGQGAAKKADTKDEAS